jgi:glycosyltransferase involved in cell wall biosynthesis
VQARPLVSIVTPTWNRHQLLLERCIPSVEHQTYLTWEHIVVSDGPDPELAMIFRQRPMITFEQMTWHDQNVLWGNRARIKGQEMAMGEIIAHLDDDNAWRPEHLELLVERLIDTGADFVYSRMIRHPNEDEVGSSPPRYAQIDTSLLVHRREILDIANWIPHHERPDPDWELVERWINGGATWAYVPEITCDYYIKGY